MSFAKKHNSDWMDYRFFLEVARQGSLKAAAKVLKVNQSTVYRRIEGLEARIDVRLFDRHQTGYRLTAAGEDILADIEATENLLQGVETRLMGQEARLSGVIKISTSDTLGYFWLPAYVKSFAAKYPDITLDIDITTRFRNLSKREADIVLSASNSQPDTMVGRALMPIQFRLYATPAYLEGRSWPIIPSDLKQHHVLMPNDSLAGLGISKWLAKHTDDPAGPVASDKLTGLYQASLQNLGIAPLPTYIGDTDSRLLALMDAPEETQTSLWLLTHPDLRHSARISAFMEHMRRSCAATV